MTTSTSAPPAAPASDPVEAFAEAISGAGLPVPEIIADGALHRFPTNDKGSDDAGWYVLHLNGVAAGAFGDWRTGQYATWSAQAPDDMDRAEARKLRKRWRQIQHQRQAEREQRQKEAARRASGIWRNAHPAPAGHPYLLAKGIRPHSIRADDDGLLIIPMRVDGEIVSLQFIDGDGDKKFLPGGRVTGAYYPIGALGDVAYVCEGFATGASIHEATGHAVAVAFSAGNLEPVAAALRAKYPDRELVIAADNDVRDDDSENTGVVAAREAANAVNGRLVVPELDGQKCDFNDIHHAHGLEAVRDTVDGSCAGSASPEGAALLDDTRDFITRFCAFPSDDHLAAVTLWAAHAHMVGHFHVTPRLALLSPEPASGKTRVLEVLELLVPLPEYSLSASPASIFRLLAKQQVTLLFDEVDAIWSQKGKDDHNEDLRALLNAGYKCGASIPRCVGSNHEVQRFPVFCAVALAGLGDLPDTIMSRAVIVRMRRRAPHEQVSEFRQRKHGAEGHALAERLATWGAEVGRSCGDAWPELPDGIMDRPAEIWEPLIAVADAAGGHWPETARAACVALCRAAEDRQASLGVRLLADLRTVFGDAEALHTETILERLHNPEDHGLDADAPWPDLRGKPLGTRGLASMLRRYGVKPRKVKVDGRSLQGYRHEHLWDAWQRYLPTPGSGEAEPPEPPVQAPSDAVCAVRPAGTPAEPAEPALAAAVPEVPRGDHEGNRHRSHSDAVVPEVPEVPDSREPERGREVVEL